MLRLFLLALFFHIFKCNSIPENTFEVQRIQGGYTCDVFLESLNQELSSTPPSLANFYVFIHAMPDHPDADADKTAASALEQVHPLQEGELSFDIWTALFYGCTVGTHRDTVTQRIFRLGLIKCARALKAKGIYDVAQYLWPRDSNGDSLMHLAVRSGNPQMVNMLGDLLHAQVLNLLDGPFAKNRDGDVPYALAMKLRLYGVVDAVKDLFNAYFGFKPPPIPKKPIPVELPTIDLIKPIPGAASVGGVDDHGAQSYIPTTDNNQLKTGNIRSHSPVSYYPAPEVDDDTHNGASAVGSSQQQTQRAIGVGRRTARKVGEQINWEQPKFQMDRLQNGHRVGSGAGANSISLVFKLFRLIVVNAILIFYV